MTRNRDERYDSRNDFYRNDMERSEGMYRDRNDGRFSSRDDHRGMERGGGYGGMDRENFGRDNYDRGGSSDWGGYGQSGSGQYGSGMDRDRQSYGRQDDGGLGRSMGGQGYGSMGRDSRGMGEAYRDSQGISNQGYSGRGYGSSSSGQDYGRGGGRGYGGMGQDRSGYSDDYSSGMRQGAYSDPYQGNPGYSSGSSMGSYGRDNDMGSGMTSHRGKGPKGYQRSDERLKEMVSEALEDEHGVDASDVEVKVENGEVTLTGTVQDRSQKRRAEDCAEGVRGIRDVHNQIRVKRNDGSGQTGDSSTLTASATSSSQKNKAGTNAS